MSRDYLLSSVHLCKIKFHEFPYSIVIFLLIFSIVFNHSSRLLFLNIKAILPQFHILSHYFDVCNFTFIYLKWKNKTQIFFIIFQLKFFIIRIINFLNVFVICYFLFSLKSGFRGFLLFLSFPVYI